MMSEKILLVCGAGASSGFMAAAARKAAKKKGVDYEIKARSESELTENLSGYDLLLIAPHLKYMLAEVKEIGVSEGIKFGLIPQRIYGALDGNGLIDFAQQTLKEEEN